MREFCVDFFFQDDKTIENQKRMSNTSTLEFRRRHSSLESNTKLNASIILRPTIFRRNFRPCALQPRDFVNNRRKIRTHL